MHTFGSHKPKLADSSTLSSQASKNTRSQVEDRFPEAGVRRRRGVAYMRDLKTNKTKNSKTLK